MLKPPRILAVAGSKRQGSYNVTLIKNAIQLARSAGAEVTWLDLAELPLPLFDEELEAAGAPPEVRKLKDLFLAHDALLIASPEYNSSITPLLKNVIDWASREPNLACFRGKVGLLISASPGALGGLRGLVTVRSILGNIGVMVLPDQLAITKAHEAFTDDGKLKDAGLQTALDKICQRLVAVTAKLNATVE